MIQCILENHLDESCCNFVDKTEKTSFITSEKSYLPVVNLSYRQMTHLVSTPMKGRLIAR